MKLGGFIGARPTWSISSRAGVWRLKDTFKFLVDGTWPNIIGIPLPVITLSASPTSIFVGDSSLISWSTTNADTVVSSNFGASALSGSVSVTPSVNTTYSLTVSGPGGKTTKTVNVVTAYRPPTVSISFSPSSITTGNSSTLSWSSTNATSVVSSNFGATTVNGSTTLSPSTSTTYNITVSGLGGTASASSTLSVSQPTPSISLSPSSITTGNSSVLSWSAPYANTVSTNFGQSATSGSILVSPSTTTTYTITAYGSAGSASNSATLYVSQPAPTVSIYASPSSISTGGSTTLYWSTTDATSISTNFGATALNGSQTVYPSTSTTYTITAYGPGGSASSSTYVSVVCNPTATADSYGLYYTNCFVTAARGTYYGNLIYQTSFYAASTYATQPPDPRGYITYAGIIYYIDQAYRSVGRPADQGGISYWIGQFVSYPSSYPTLSDLYNGIRNSYYVSSEYNTYGFIYGYGNSCNQTWNTAY